MVKISVIIPVYNAEQYLVRCLDSVINQSLQDIEIICVNDCSTDNSLEILENYAKNDKRIKIINCKINGGESKARNTGIDNAQGEYIAFLDNDDRLDLDFYEKLYNQAIKENAQVCRGEVSQYNLNGQIKHSGINQLFEKSRCRMYFSTTWWTAIYKRDFINENNFRLPENIILGGDILFLNNVMLKTQRFSFVDGTFYHYYRRSDSGDSAILPINKVRSALGVYKQIIKNINQAFQEKNINKEEYDYVYQLWFLSIINLSMRNKDYQVKELCTEELLNTYALCLRTPDIDEILKKDYISLFEYIKTNDKKSLLNYLMKNDSAIKIKMANTRYNIRKK